jgi:hypothetical protein
VISTPIVRTDPIKALVEAYDIWHAIDEWEVADRDRVVMNPEWMLEIGHGGKSYVLKRVQGETRQYPIVLKNDVGGGLFRTLTGAKGSDTGRVSFGQMSGKALHGLADLKDGADAKSVKGLLQCRDAWKTVYAYALRSIDAPWKDDLLTFFENGLSLEDANLVDEKEHVRIVVAAPNPCELIDMDGFMEAFDTFMCEIRSCVITSRMGIEGIDPITGKPDMLVSKMMYLPAPTAVIKSLPNNGPLSSNGFRETTNFFGSLRFRPDIGVSDTSDFKCAAILDYMVRHGHRLNVGDETIFWYLSGEAVEDATMRGVTLVDIDNVGKYMFALYQGKPVSDNATFGHFFDDCGDKVDVTLNVLRVSGNGARPVYKGIRSYSWDTLVRNHEAWCEDTFLWEVDNPKAPDAVAMRAGIDGWWEDSDDGKRHRYHWGLVDALSCSPSRGDDVNTTLRDDLVRMCVDGEKPSQRLILALAQAMQSYWSSRRSLVMGQSDFDFKVVQYMRARLAQCVFKRW